jgi:BTB/POZ domain-containing protein KCTD9
VFGLFKKNAPPGPRLGYEESCRRLQPRHLDSGAIPPLPARVPQSDDEVLGVSFFRTLVDGTDDLANLTLPRTFFGRSEIAGASFRNTDLSESNLCWNDFIDVDFTHGRLAGSDLRASRFAQVRFISSDLARADLRQSLFEECVFKDATMAGTVLTSAQGRRMPLSDRQRAEIAWTDDDGPEPMGG